jgi:hypothetical protein
MILKFPFYTGFFNGLEYEDTYIYNASARYSSYNQDSFIDPFLTKSCSSGPLNNCEKSVTYSGHVIGYPSVILFFTNIFGYHPNLINYMAIFFSTINTVFLYIIAFKILKDNKFPLLVTFLYSSIPIFNLFSTTALSEPFSSSIITLSTLIYLLYVHHSLTLRPKWESIVNWISILTLFWFSTLVKRENIMLLPLLSSISLLISFFEHGEGKKTIIKRLITTSPIMILIMLFYLFKMEIFKTLMPEAIEAGGPPFSFKFFWLQFPVYVKSLLNLNWFFIYSVFIPVGIYFAVAKRMKYALFPFFIFLSYFLLYAFHYRSYYSVQTKSINTFDTLRYLIHAASWISIIMGIGIYYFFKIPFKKIVNERYYKKAMLVVIGLAIIFNIVQIHHLRKEYYSIEQLVRINPIITTIEVSHQFKDPIILTSESLLFSILGNDNLNVIDLYGINADISEKELDSLIAQNDVLYLWNPWHDEEIEKNRFTTAFEYINKKNKTKLREENSIFKVYKIL